MAKRKEDAKKVPAPAPKSAPAVRRGRSTRKESPLTRKTWGYDPMLGLESIKTTMSEMLADLFSKKGSWNADLPLEPSVDLYEEDGSLVVEVLLPGVQKKDLQIHATRDLLIISGEMKRDNEIAESRFHMQERRFGQFSRSLPLPFQVEPEEIKAELADGVLVITLPSKGEQTRTYKIPIE
ncbi:MAG: Hsp20/alpha crystallin family protein [Candidatus Xenobia bacterium]